MRKIEKQPEPKALSEWRARHSSDPNFGYDLLAGKPAHDALKAALVEEQGGLCAYSGHAIRMETAHVEHLFPQTHCTAAESVDYRNLVACFPGPNHPSPGFGAIEKRSWPSAEERHRFVSPLSDHCESRFKFNTQGKIFPVELTDAAATETIRRLKLDAPALEKNRAAAVAFIKSLKSKEARARLTSLQREDGRLSQYCFAMKQILAKHLTVLESIKASNH